MLIINNNNNNNFLKVINNNLKQIVIYKLKVVKRAIKTYLQFLSIKKRDYFQAQFFWKKKEKNISSSYNSILIRNNKSYDLSSLKVYSQLNYGPNDEKKQVVLKV